MPIESSTVTNRSPAAGLVALGASEARQDDRLGAASHVRAVELGRDLHRERAPLHRRRGHVGVRRRGHEVAAEADEHVDVAAVHRAERVDGVEAGLARRGEAEARLERIEQRLPAASRRCPSCGHPARWSGRAPGRHRRPACRCAPRSSRVLMSSWMVATAWRCWVSPIAQQMMIRSRPATRRYSSSTAPRSRPVAANRTSGSSAVAGGRSARRTRRSRHRRTPGRGRRRRAPGGG